MTRKTFQTLGRAALSLAMGALLVLAPGCGGGGGGSAPAKTHKEDSKVPVLSYGDPAVTGIVGVVLAERQPQGGPWTGTVFTVAPDLPPGLKLHKDTGVLSGKPTAAAPAAPYTVTARQGPVTTSTVLTITVRTEAPKPVFNVDTMVCSQGVAVEDLHPFAEIWHGASYDVKPELPAGLTLDRATGTISGTPKVSAPAATYTVTASKGAQKVSAPVSITVNLKANRTLAYPAAALVCIKDSPIKPLRPSSEAWPGAVHQISPRLPEGLKLDEADGRIYGTPSAVAPRIQYTVTATKGNETATATLKLTVLDGTKKPASRHTTLEATAGAALAEFHAFADPWPGASYKVQPDLPAGLKLDAGTGAITGKPAAAAAAATYTVTATKGAETVTATVELTIKAAPRTLAYPAGSLVCTRGVAITDLLPSSEAWPGALYTASPKLPAGLDIDAHSGKIFGTPTAASPATQYTVTASEGAEKATATLEITVNQPATRILTYPAGPLVGTVNVAIPDHSPTSAAWPGAIHKISPDLPEGLTLEESTGRIHGTPKKASKAASYTVTASKDGETATATLDLQVDAPAPRTFTYPAGLQVFSTGASITDYLPDTPVWPDATYSISPDLPDGLHLNQYSGKVYGKPTKASPATKYTVTATRNGETATATVEIQINLAAPKVGIMTYATPVMICTRNVPIASNLITSGGWPYDASYSVSPKLPAGLDCSIYTGRIYGTPSVVSPATTYTVTATKGSETAVGTFTLTVNAPPPVVWAYTIPDLVCDNDGKMVSISPVKEPWPGATYSVSPKLPDGFFFNKYTGVIDGWPYMASPATTYTVTATSATVPAETSTTTVKITVNTLKPHSLTYAGLPNRFTLNIAIVDVLPSHKGGAPTDYKIAPALPEGLELTGQKGILRGKPTKAAPMTEYTVTASNAGGSTTCKIKFAVGPEAPANLDYALPASLPAGAPIAPPIAPTCQGGKPTSYKVAPALPDALKLDPDTGILSGTPKAATPAASYVVTASNAGGSTTCTLKFAVEGDAGEPRITLPPYVTADDSGTASVPDQGAGWSYQWTVVSGGKIANHPKKRAMTFRVGPVGTPFKVSVTMTGPAGAIITREKTAEIAPSPDLKVQAPAVLHPGDKHVVARVEKVDGLTYQWEVGGGKERVQITSPITTTHEIKFDTFDNLKDDDTFSLKVNIQNKAMKFAHATAQFRLARGVWVVRDAPKSFAGNPDQITATRLSDGTVLVVGGRFKVPGIMAELASAVYNPENNSWLDAELPLQDAFVSHTATATRDLKNVLVVGQTAGGPKVSLFSVLDFNWTDKAGLKTPRTHHAAALTQDGLRVIVTGGRKPGTKDLLRDTESYELASNTWTTLGAMNHARESHTLTTLGNGRLLAVGGGATPASAELLNPATGAWTSTGALKHPRTLHTATLLKTGRVLVAGGEGLKPGTRAELFDPAAGTWAETGAMRRERFRHTATMLDNGSVIAAGGRGAKGQALLLAESYDPATGAWTPAEKLHSERIGHAAALIKGDTVLTLFGSTADIASESYMAPKAQTGGGGHGGGGGGDQSDQSDSDKPTDADWATLEIGLDKLKAADRDYEKARKAYNKLKVQWHPDKHPGNQKAATEAFQKIQGAFDRIKRSYGK